MANTPNNMTLGSCLTYEGTYIYALQGNGTKNFYRYNISANTWTAMATTPVNMKAGAALTFDGSFIYATAGNATKGYYRYDRTANTWTSMANTSVAVSAGGSLVTFGDGYNGDASATFTESPALCQDLTIKAGTIDVKTYVSITGGTMPASPNITAALMYGTTTIITLSSPTYNSTTGTLSWSGTLGSDVTVPSGNALKLVITFGALFSCGFPALS